MPSSATISQRAFRAAVDQFKSAGLPEVEVFRDIPTQYLLPGRTKVVPWDLYCDLIARGEKAFGGPLELERSVAESYHRVLPELRLVAGSVLTPLALCEAIMRFSAPHFPVSHQISALPDGRVLVAVKLLDGAKDAPQLFRGTVGSARGMPAHLALRLAEVEGEIGPRHAMLLIHMPDAARLPRIAARWARAAKAMIRQATRKAHSFLGHGSAKLEPADVGPFLRQQRTLHLLERIEVYGRAVADCRNREDVVSTILDIVTSELGCERAWLYRRAGQSAGYQQLGGSAGQPSGVLRLYSMRTAAGEAGRLETSTPRETALLDALAPWFGLALAHSLAVEESMRPRATNVISLRERISRATDEWTLTLRHQQILEGIARGLSNKQVAEELDVSEKTVEYHIGQLFRRAGVHSRAQLTTTLFAL